MLCASESVSWLSEAELQQLSAALVQAHRQAFQRLCVARAQRDSDAHQASQLLQQPQQQPMVARRGSEEDDEEELQAWLCEAVRCLARTHGEALVRGGYGAGLRAWALEAVEAHRLASDQRTGLSLLATLLEHCHLPLGPQQHEALLARALHVAILNQHQAPSDKQQQQDGAAAWPGVERAAWHVVVVMLLLLQQQHQHHPPQASGGQAAVLQVRKTRRRRRARQTRGRQAGRLADGRVCVAPRSGGGAAAALAAHGPC